MQEHAEQQEQQVEQRQHRPLVLRELCHRLRELLRRLHFGEIRAEERARRHQQHYHRGLHGAVDHRLPELRDVELAIDEKADDDGRDNRERRAFGRGHHAAEDAAEDDDRQQERPERVARRARDTLERKRFLARQVITAAHVIRIA